MQGLSVSLQVAPSMFFVCLIGVPNQNSKLAHSLGFVEKAGTALIRGIPLSKH